MLALYPPRPGGAIPPATLAKYRGYVGQFKFNDIRALIEIGPDGQIAIQGRRRDPLKSYSLTVAARRSLESLALARGVSHVLDGGIMRSACPRTGHKAIVIWDILVHEGKHLLGTTYAQRYGLLKQACRNPAQIERESGWGLALSVGPELWLTRTFSENLPERFAWTERTDMLEGLMLKNPAGRLERGLAEENNGSWQLRVRKTSGRHVF